MSESDACIKTALNEFREQNCGECDIAKSHRRPEQTFSPVRQFLVHQYSL